MSNPILMPTQFSARVAGPSRRSLTPAGGAGAAVAQRRRVAIVEDQLIAALTLEAILEHLGHCVAGIYPDGEAALSVLLRDPVELVLMDINLGVGLDGIETAQQINTAWGTPIIFVSAYDDSSTREQVTLAVPGALMVSKPVQAADLEAALALTFSAAN